MILETEDILKAKQIVDKLMQHPGVSLFVDGNGARSLNLVIQKLEMNSIKTLPQFQQEVEGVFNIADHIYPEHAMAKQFGQYFKQTFKKEVAKTFLNAPVVWSKRVISLERKLEKLQLRNPLDEKYSQIAFIPTLKIASQVISDRDCTTFSKAVSATKDQGDLEQLYKMVEEMQPELTNNGTNLRIPIMKLKPTTIKALIKKLKEIYKEKQVAFPA